MSGGDETVLAIVAAEILDRDGPAGEHQPGIGEVQPPMAQRLGSLLRVEADVRSISVSHKIGVSSSMATAAWPPEHGHRHRRRRDRTEEQPRLQTKLLGQERETPREYLDQESHYVWGRRYLLQVVERDAAASVDLAHHKMVLRVHPGAHDATKRTAVEAWYREQVKTAAPPLIAKWQPLLGVTVARFFVQRMKTKWGSCNAETRSIRLNTDLAKKPPECLEYIIVHEMVHLIVRRHDDRFARLMDRCLPNWRLLRQMLNSAPLSHAEWLY